MPVFHAVYGELKGKASIHEARDVLSTITRYHRIQGSRELWLAAKDLRDLLVKQGLEARVERIEPGAVFDEMESPVSWDPVEAALEIRIGGKKAVELRLNDHPTLLSAHSPPGEGCGEISICREPPCDGEVVLATTYPPYILYREIDSKLILYYRKTPSTRAVPYTGLFIGPGEVKDTVVMNIPYETAAWIIEEKQRNPRTKIEACWNAKVQYHGLGLPILYSCRGRDPGILYISHLCHPKPGAHDNASGSAGNILVELTLERARIKTGTCHAWTPEYTGTVYLRRLLPELPKAVVNLDMIGSRQWLTGSTLTLINPPRFIPYGITPLLDLSVKTALGDISVYTGFKSPRIRYTPAPYGIGSDHDITTLWGIESPMLNEWPSRNYHTDADTPDTISPVILVKTAEAAALAGVMYHRLSGDKITFYTKLYNDHVKTIYHEQAIIKGFPITFLQQHLIKKPASIPVKPVETRTLFIRRIYGSIGLSNLKRLRKIPKAIDAITVYVPLARKLGVRRPFKAFQAEVLTRWKRKEESTVREAYSILWSG